MFPALAQQCGEVAGVAEHNPGSELLVSGLYGLGQLANRAGDNDAVPAEI
jgi:hypothetical protein